MSLVETRDTVVKHVSPFETIVHSKLCTIVHWASLLPERCSVDDRTMPQLYGNFADVAAAALALLDISDSDSEVYGSETDSEYWSSSTRSRANTVELLEGDIFLNRESYIFGYQMATGFEPPQRGLLAVSRYVSSLMSYMHEHPMPYADLIALLPIGEMLERGDVEIEGRPWLGRESHHHLQDLLLRAIRSIVPTPVERYGGPRERHFFSSESGGYCVLGGDGGVACSSYEYQADDYDSDGWFGSSSQSLPTFTGKMGSSSMLATGVKEYLRGKVDDMTVDKYIKHMESLLMNGFILKNCTTYAMSVAVIAQYVHQHFDTSMCGFIMETIQGIFKQEIEVQSSAWEEVRGVIEKWGTIVNSSLVSKIKKVVALLVAAGVCSIAKLPFGQDTFSRFYEKSGVANLHAPDVCLQICECFVHIVDKCMYFFVPGQMMNAFYDNSKASKFEKLYADVMSKKDLVEAGNLSQVELDLPAYCGQVADLVKMTEEYLKSCESKSAKANIGAKLVKAKQLYNAVVTDLRKQTIRQQPLGLVLVGPTSIGKTNLVTAIISNLLAYNGVPIVPGNIISLNASDKYQSEMHNAVDAIILDDLANTLPEHATGNHAQLILDIINNNPTCALRADVESKGNVFYNPKIVVGTTNVANLGAHHYSAEPISILRRFKYHIDVTVKPEYRDKRYGTETHMLDPSKMTSDKLVHDAWTFCVSEVRPPKGQAATDTPARAEYAVCKMDGKPMHAVSLEQLLLFLQPLSKEHFDAQKTLVASRVELLTAPPCPHGMICDICSVCSSPLLAPDADLSVQAGGTTDEHVSWWEWLDTKCSYFCFERLSWFNRRVRVKKYVKLIHKEGFVNTMQAIKRGIIVTTFLIGTSTIAFALLWFPFAVYYWLMCISFAYGYWQAQILAFKDAAYEYVVNEPFAAVRARIYKKTTWLYGGAALVLLLGLVKTVKVMWGFYKQSSLEEQGAQVSAPARDAVERVNVWRTPYLSSREERIVDMTAANLHRVVSEKIAFADYAYKAGGGTTCGIMPLKSNFWLAPWHVMQNDVATVELLSGERQYNGSTVTLTLGKDAWYRIPDSDMAVLYLPGAGPQRDLVRYLPESKYPDEGYPARMIHRGPDGHVSTQDFHAVAGRTTVGDVTYDSLKYDCPNATFKGLCIAPVMHKFEPYFLGFHSAGVTGTSRGVAHQVTQLQVNSAIKVLLDRTHVFEAHSTNGVCIESPAYGFTLTGSIHAKSPLCFLPDGAAFKSFGAHTGMRRHYKSVVKPSLISKAVEDIMGVPSTHGPPKFGTWEPWQKQLAELVKPHELPYDMLGKAYEDYSEHVLEGLSKVPGWQERVHPYDNVTVVSGADQVYGVDAINIKTSAGYPFNVSKRKYIVELEDGVESVTCAKDVTPEMWEIAEEYEKALARGERVHTVFRASLKDEPVKTGSDKVRVFAGSSLPLLLLVRRYFLSICKLIMENGILFETAVGVDAHGPAWTELSTYMNSKGTERSIAGDYSKYDLHMAAQVTLLAMKFMIMIAALAGYTEEQLTIMRGLATEICYPMYEFNGEFIQINGSSPSGHPLTVFLNGIVNCFYIRLCWYVIYMGCPPTTFAKSVALMCYGDDNRMSVAEGCGEFNHTSISEVLGRYGIKYTMPDKEAVSVPYVHGDKCTFLKRASVWSEEYGQYLAPIEEATLYKMLHCRRDVAMSPEMHAATALGAVARECFYHGYAFFESYRVKLNAVIVRCDLRECFPMGELPPFTHYEAEYLARCAKHHL